jgi:O-antigen/teichoic acid export membrane protein
MSVFGPARYRKCLPVYVANLLGFHFILGLFLSGVVVAGIGGLRYLTADRNLTSALWGVCVGTPLILFFWVCRRAAYLKLAPSLAAAGAAAYCTAVVSLLFLTKSLGLLSTFTAFLIQSFAAMVAGAFLFVSLRPQFDSRSGPSSSAIVREHWGYGRWVVGTQFVYWLSGNAYYVIVAAFLRMQDVAALRALQNFTLPFGQFLSAISLLVLPWASARFAEEGRLGFQRRVRQISVLFTGMASAYYAVLWVFGGKIMQVLYAGRYGDSAHLLTLAAAPVVVLAASQGSTIGVQAMQAPAEVLLAYSVSGTLTIFAGVALARYWGLAGALTGMLASSLGFWVVITWRRQRRLTEVTSIGISESGATPVR